MGFAAGAGAHRSRRAVVVGLLVLAVATIAGLIVGGSGVGKEPIFDFCTSGTQGGQCSTPRGVAINQSGTGAPAGTVYVVDFTNHRVQSFNADGAFIRAWGHDVISGGGTGFEICELATSCKAGTFGGAAGQFQNPPAGIAVDQGSGSVYVIDRANNRIQQFSATGGFIRTWGADVDTGGGSGFEICETAANCKAGVEGSGAGMFDFTNAIVGIGADSGGNVYVADADNKRVQKFSSSGAFLRMGGWDVVETGPGDDTTPPEDEYEVCVPADGDVCKAGTAGPGAGQYGTESLPSYLATSPAGDVFVVGRDDGTIYRLDSSLAFVEDLPATAGAGNNRNALALNPADGHLFFAKAGDTNVYEIDPVTEATLEVHPAGGTSWVGMAVNSTNGRIYLTQFGSPFVRVLGEKVAVSTIEVPEFPSWTAATLKGTVNPEGLPVSQCRFEYGPTTAYGTVVPCAQTPAEIGEGTAPVPVHADISGLEANGAEYNVRLVAVNENGLGPSPNLEFETPAAVVTNPATAVSAATAILNGSVNPLGHPLTECFFEYGKTTEYGEAASCVPDAGGVGSGSSPVPVQADVNLDPGSVYHFRLVAANAPDGQAKGKDLTLQTLGPALGETWSEGVDFTEAILNAEVDPEGKATTFRFEYGVEGPCETNPCASVPVPDGQVGSDSTLHEVSAFLEGLVPGATYHYRVVATNSDAASESPDRTFDTYAPLDPDPCTNDAFRTGAAAVLPDCRAHEMVSPVDKGGGDIVAAERPGAGEAAFRQAASGGDRITYTSVTSFGDAQRGAYANQYLAERGPESWSNHALNPPQGTTVFDPTFNLRTDLDTAFQAFTPDLCFALMQDQNLAPLRPEAIHGYTNLYLRDNCGSGADTYEAITTGEAPAYSALGPELQLQGHNYSSDLRNVVFTAKAALEGATPAPAVPAVGGQIYHRDRSEGDLRLVSVLPGGEASAESNKVGTGVARRQATLANAVSGDGSRVFWTADPSAEEAVPGALYVRVNAGEAQSAFDGAGKCSEPEKACTIEIAQPLTATKGLGQFWTANGEGSRAIFSVGDGFSADVDAELYELDVDKAIAEGGSEGAKTPIAGELGGVVGAARDLSRLYFTSEEDLDEGAVEGELNLYLREGGEVSLIARLAALTDGEEIDHRFPSIHSSRVSPDGRHLAFMSNASLTGYDNADANTGEPASEVFVYDAVTDELSCASCNPSRARPVGQKRLGRHTAAWIPTWEWANRAARSLADDGNRVFFNSFDALVPQDVNGVQDVYQWEAPGSGTCEVGDPDYFAVNQGCVNLISVGHSPARSQFMDASADGGDVFFTTESSIDPRDPGLVDIYDARVGGGYPPPPPEDESCVGDSCQVVPAPPGVETPASATFQGPPDAKPKTRCRKGKVRRKGRCVARKKERRRNKGQRRAGSEGRAAR